MQQTSGMYVAWVAVYGTLYASEGVYVIVTRA